MSIPAAATETEPLPPRAPAENTRVDRNFLTYLICQVLSWAVTFLTMSVIPRSIGEANSGKVLLAMTVTTVPITILGLGVDQFLTKEVGRDRSQTAELLGATLALRIVLLVPSILGSIAIALALHAAPYDWLLISVLVPAMVATSFVWSLKSTFVGMEQARRAGMIDMLVAWAPLYALPFIGYGAVALVTAITAVTLLVLGLGWKWIRASVSIRLRFRVDIWRRLIRGGLPFCINNYLLSLYGLVSVFVVRIWLGDEGLGAVGQVSKLFGTFMFIPTAMTSALLPSLARMAETDPEGFDRAKSRVLAVLLVFGLPVTSLAVVLAHPLSHLLYSRAKFLDVPLALQTIAFGVLPMYVVSTMYQFLAAQGRAHLWSRFLLLTVVIYGAVAYVATPLCLRMFHNGPMGASVATVVSEGIGAIASIILLRVRLLTVEFAARTLRAFGATLLMSVAMSETLKLMIRLSPSADYGASFLQLIVPAAVGLAVFAVCVAYLRILYPQDEQRVGGLLRHVVNRLRDLGRTKTVPSA